MRCLCVTVSTVLLMGGAAIASQNTNVVSGTEIPLAATEAGITGIFHILDCTNEGYVNTGEVTEHGGALFRRMDRDRNRKISRQEYVAFMDKHWAPLREKLFTQADKDQDGTLNHIDFADHLTEMIIATDINKDGDASWVELMTLRGETDQVPTRSKRPDFRPKSISIGLRPKSK